MSFIPIIIGYAVTFLGIGYLIIAGMKSALDLDSWLWACISFAATAIFIKATSWAYRKYLTRVWISKEGERVDLDDEPAYIQESAGMYEIYLGAILVLVLIYGLIKLAWKALF